MKRTNTAVWMENQSRWQIKVQKDGIRKSFYSSTTGRAGQREANAKADAWLDDNITNAKIKVAEMSKRYMDELKITTSKSHWRQYEGYFTNWINPAIGTVSMQNVNEQHLQTVINAGYKAGLSKKTLSNLKACLTAFIKFCRKNKVTALLPESLYIPKGAPANEKKILQPEDIKKLFTAAAAENEMYLNAYRFAVVSGLRPSELIGLKWEDISEGILHLKRAINAYGETTKGKNENAQRNFRLTDLQKNILKNQAQELENLSIKLEYVFPDIHGEPVKQITYYKRWRKLRDEIGVSEVTPYELRHTFVSAVKTLPEGYLKQLVGHSKDMDTYGVYSHQVKTDMDETATLVDRIFESILKDE